MDLPLKIMIGTALLIVGLVTLLVHLIHEDEKKWNAFKAEHQCRVVAQVKGSASMGYSASGKGGIIVVQEPDKTGWLCDDGVTYFR